MLLYDESGFFQSLNCFLKTKVDYIRTAAKQKIVFDDKMKTLFEEEIKKVRKEKKVDEIFYSK